MKGLYRSQYPKRLALHEGRAVSIKMRKKKVGDMRGEEACNKKVAECVEKNDFSMLKNVVVLKAPENSGKTTILKMVIEILYDRNPASWEGRGLARGNQFNRLRVTNYAEANRLSHKESFGEII